MEVDKLVRRGDEGTCVNQDAESWSKLEPGVCDMILEKLPCSERLRLRVVCKNWNRSVLKRVERKPYFVTILRSSSFLEYLNGLVVYDVVSKSMSFEPLPSKLHFTGHYHFAPFAVEGLISSNQPKAMSWSELRSYDRLEDVSEMQWCVYNIHTSTKYVVPPAPRIGGLRRYFCGMMVDTSIKPYTFKLVACNSTGEETQIYDSSSSSWSLHPNPNSNSNSSLLDIRIGDLYVCMCHKDCMYMSTKEAGEGVLVYSVEKDRWSTLSGSPFRGEERPYLGAWDDRIFAVLHDAEAKKVTVWELIDAIQQEWVEYARCSKAQYEQLMVNYGLLDDRLVEYYEFEIVSVFSEEYVLMYNLYGGRSYALVLLNLKTREWESVASIRNMIDKTKGVVWMKSFFQYSGPA